MYTICTISLLIQDTIGIIHKGVSSKGQSNEGLINIRDKVRCLGTRWDQKTEIRGDILYGWSLINTSLNLVDGLGIST